MQAERTIRKHVAIIHAYSLMGALQRKVFNALLYYAMQDKGSIRHENSVAVECRIPLSSVANAVNFNSHNNDYLKKTIDDLASLTIEWNLLKDKVPTEISFLNLRILHGAPTFYQDSTFNFSFHKVMLSLISNPSIYGTIDLDMQAMFESKYSHSLYENSTRFVHLKKDKIIQLDTFKKLLGVNSDKYMSMKELTRNVIKLAVEEVNDRADFLVKLNAIKVGRKVTGFELAVSNKKLSPINKICEPNDDKVLKDTIHQVFGGISESVLENILKNYSEAYILEKIAYTKKYAKNEKSGFYPIPYFISALRDNYKSNDEAKAPLNQPKISDPGKEWKEELLHLQADLDHWKKQLDYAHFSQKQDAIVNSQSVVDGCEQKLQQHLTNKVGEG